jgi:ring-1,2-phenylacetyl-CoA epoxidase subunit PaaE
LKSALLREANSRITLIYSNSSISSAIFYEELVQLKTRYPNQLFIEWMFSNATDLMQARLGTFNLQRMLHKHLKYQKSDALVYTCGPFYFMLMVQITCLSMGFSKQNIRREIFDIIDNVPVEKRYYDENDRTITLLNNGISYKLYVPYNQSILTAALSRGIELPYSCRAGRCSTCRCRVIHGKVWMHNNEVLTDEDEANGYALTCTGHPTSEGVVIEV